MELASLLLQRESLILTTILIGFFVIINPKYGFFGTSKNATNGLRIIRVGVQVCSLGTDL
jgi:hypothetical protein